MRTLTDHQVNPANDQLSIIVADEPGAGGAHHRYEIRGFNSFRNPSADEGDQQGYSGSLVVLFQNGPIGEAGINGVTQEALIAICIDRLECFQAGDYKCEENARALDHLKMAQKWLLNRTRARMARGVEGTHAK